MNFQHKIVSKLTVELSQSQYTNQLLVLILIFVATDSGIDRATSLCVLSMSAFLLIYDETLQSWRQ